MAYRITEGNFLNYSAFKLSSGAEAPLTLKLQRTSHSERRLFTGFTIAAFTTCKPIVAMAITIAANADRTKTHPLMFIL